MSTNLDKVNFEALKSDIRSALITESSFAGPIAIRVAWHASGTYDKDHESKGCPMGGSNGATMRFDPEKSDGANAGLSIIRDMLHGVHKKNPHVSLADLWTLAGTLVVEWMGGPQIPFSFGRTDLAEPDAKHIPENGRLPDASQGAQHLRDVFYRMGFNDQEIVALSGAHTTGRCHASRSGFDGPWTEDPLKFDNQYFVGLLEKKWVKKEWDGPEQFVDAETGKLMMLPTDIALIEDAEFKKWVEVYAKDEAKFFADFAESYGKLLSLGCPAAAKPTELSDAQKAGAELREAAMHGSVDVVKKLAEKADINELEASSGRSALHKAAFWGHNATVEFLIGAGAHLDVQDSQGHTALHDAAKFGHETCAKMLVDAGANASLKNNAGQTAKELATDHGYANVATLL